MSLKARVALRYLAPLLLIYVGAVTALASGGELSWALMTTKSAPAAALCLLCQLLQDLLPKPIKEALVFWRMSDRLPGHRAYTQVCESDSRINSGYLEEIRAQNPMDGRSQNSMWYGQYLELKDQPQVAHESFRYLAWRDVTVVLWMLAIGTLGLLVIRVLPPADAFTLALLCLGGALVTTVAARNTAASLVRNVVAQTAVQVQKPRGRKAKGKDR